MLAWFFAACHYTVLMGGKDSLMRKLFLASYFKDVISLFPDFAGNDCVGKKVVFIPTASLHEKFAFYVAADRKALQELGMIVEDLEIANTSSEEIAKTITRADYIFVSGGNTYFLLQELKRKGADKMIVEHINKGKLYIGTSAGSVLLSKDIGYIQYMDTTDAAPDLNGDYTALSVVDFYIVPHATNFPFRKTVQKTIKAFSEALDIRAISNHQVIVVDGDNVRQLADESKTKGRTDHESGV